MYNSLFFSGEYQTLVTYKLYRRLTYHWHSIVRHYLLLRIIICLFIQIVVLNLLIVFKTFQAMEYNALVTLSLLLATSLKVRTPLHT